MGDRPRATSDGGLPARRVARLAAADLRDVRLAVAVGQANATHFFRPATEGFVSAEQYAQRAKAIPLRRNGTPEDVAHAAAFLLSDEAAFINGAMLAIDGGIIAAG